jgi:hypothetical protein
MAPVMKNMRRTNPAAPAVFAVLLLAGCWYHRVDVPSPVTVAAESSETAWTFLWRSRAIEPGAECVTGSLKEVVVRSNWGFSLLRVATLGLVAPVRLERHCARPIIHDVATLPDTGASAPPGRATYWSIGWGSYQGEPGPDCNGRPIAKVVLKANPVFDFLSLVTLGAASPTRVGWECVARTPVTPDAPESRQ